MTRGPGVLDGWTIRATAQHPKVPCFFKNMAFFSPVPRVAVFPGGLIRCAWSWVGCSCLLSWCRCALPMPSVKYEGQCEAWNCCCVHEAPCTFSMSC